MIPLSARDIFNFQPEHYRRVQVIEACAAARKADKDITDAALAAIARDVPFPPETPVYRIGTPSIWGMRAFRRDCVAAGARFPTDAELRRALVAFVERTAIEGQDQLIELIEAAGDKDVELGAAEREVFSLLEQQAMSFPLYAALMAARQFWSEVAPLIACRHFLKSADNPPLPLTFHGGLLSEESLNAIPEDDASAIGWEALTRGQVGATQRKNSVSPSPSGATPAPTIAATSPPTAETDGK